MKGSKGSGNQVNGSFFLELLEVKKLKQKPREVIVYFLQHGERKNHEKCNGCLEMQATKKQKQKWKVTVVVLQYENGETEVQVMESDC